ncbi:tetratricopeptide repeat protein [Phenylobacterium sp.]|uniref:tetratricopeptide repeat protein n=1 Tax=Phenylobacterium sp. TaxID=1871053 RepID=UPI002715E9B4|nr:tetratricopeptide repeat protein [Phenylobacterium sp.]MDO8378007.1 tetratricopeptide repeat protein [Phenylobacterium sp.]
MLPPILIDPATGRLLAQAVADLEAGRLVQAEQGLRRVILAAPKLADARHHLGQLLYQTGRYAQAEAELRRALAIAPTPETRLGLGLAVMAQGRYPEGWRLYGARHEIPAMRLPRPRDFPYPEWRGEDLAGKHIVIFPEQGFGDQIQFARFTPQLRALGADVTLLCRPTLERLFAHSFPGARVLPAAGAVEFPDPDYWVMAGGLPAPLGTTLETLPAQPYLATPATWPALPPGLKIGLATRGSPTNGNDRHRSLTADQAAQLTAVLPGQVIDLDPAVSGARDFADTAALIAQLDLVVTVDSSMAHLAGAMGKACWVLVSVLGVDWRWLDRASDSPWYPSVRLYRQGADHAWGPVIAAIGADLARGEIG